MTGTLPSIPLSQNFDENGLPLSGCRLFLFKANTSEPVIAYKDYLLTPGMEHPQPIVADALGRIPMFWLPSEPSPFYRAKLEDRYGSHVYDEAYMSVLSTATGGGGGGSVVENPAFMTGDFLWQAYSGGRAGWVVSNALTIGNVGSGATRANTDCAALYNVLWNRYPQELCPVTGGRTNAADDWTNNKAIATLDMRGFGAMGMDEMGNTPTGRYSQTFQHSGVANFAGARVGGNASTLTWNQMPIHTHTSTVTNTLDVSPRDHVHVYTGGSYTIGSGSGGNQYDWSGTPLPTEAATLVLIGDVTVSNGNAGAGQAHDNVHLAVLGTWFVKL